MDTAIARQRLEEMRGELDKSITVLQGEQTAGQAGTDSPQDPADVGTNLSESDRVQAMLAAARQQLRAVLDAHPADRSRHVWHLRRLRWADPGGPAGCPAGGHPLREMPGQTRPGPVTVPPSAPAQRDGAGLPAAASRLIPNDSAGNMPSSPGRPRRAAARGETAPVPPGREFCPDQPLHRTRVPVEHMLDQERGQHGAGPDPADLQPSLGQQVAELADPEAAGDRAVRPGDEHHFRMRQVGEPGPAALSGEDGHAEHQRVDAGEQLPARPEHPGDLGGEVLGHQLPGQRPILGDDCVHTAGGEKGQAGWLGDHRHHHAPAMPLRGQGVRRGLPRRDHLDHGVSPRGRLATASAVWPGDVDQ